MLLSLSDFPSKALPRSRSEAFNLLRYTRSCSLWVFLLRDRGAGISESMVEEVASCAGDVATGCATGSVDEDAVDIKESEAVADSSSRHSSGILSGRGGY